MSSTLEGLKTPLCANGFMLAACGDGIRLIATFTQHPPGDGLVSTVVGDVMLSPTIAKDMILELARNIERHERMFGPIPSRDYIKDAWAEVVSPDLIDGYEKNPPKP